MEENGKYFEIRPTGGFSKVIVKVVGCLELHQEATERLLIYGGKDVLERIRTEVIDQTLTLRSRHAEANVLVSFGLTAIDIM